LRAILRWSGSDKLTCVDSQTNEPLERREWELLYLWSRHCFPTFWLQTPQAVRRFAGWLELNPLSDEARLEAASWWAVHESGPTEWELDLLAPWRQFSREEYSLRAARIDPHTARRFADWLRRRGGRTPIAALDLPVLAFHILRVNNVRFIEQLDDETLNRPVFARIRNDVVERLRSWRGESGDAGAPAAV